MSDQIAALTARSGASAVVNAISAASERTGARFDVLLNMAERESSLNPNAKAATSSAAGLFQFIEQTWMATIKQYGDAHGLQNEAAAIAKSPTTGEYTVADPKARQAILDLRFNASAASAMAGELAKENQHILERQLGRAAEAVDLYAAHFLGPAGAVKLLNAASGAIASDLLPAAAAANTHVFYDGDRPRTVGEVVAAIGRSMSVSTPASTSISTPGANGAKEPVKSAPQYSQAKAFHHEGAGAGANVSSENIARKRATSRLSEAALMLLQSIDPTRLLNRPDRDDRSIDPR